VTSRTWYRIAFARPAAPPLVVVAPGAHLGEAIANGVRHVGRGAWAAAVALADASEVPLGEAFGKHDVVERGPEAGLATGLRWPLGVVPSFADVARAAAVREGFARRALEGGGEVVEAVVDGPRVDEALLSIVERLPAADNVEVKVLHTYDGAGSTDVWLTPRLDVKKAIRLLDDHDIELLHNGHVEVSIYLRAQKATLRLGEHKTIAWMSEDPALAERAAGWLRLAGLEEAPELVTIADVGHFHWRPAATSPRRRLIEHLKKLGMRQVDSWKPDQASPRK
jgi:hypothetical protein